MKYTKELLEVHVPDATSFTDLARRLNIAPIGSNTTNLAIRCKQHGVDTSHFTGSAHQKGRPSRNRLTPNEILILGSNIDIRVPGSRLAQAMIEVGVEYVCNVCGSLPMWHGRVLNLQVDHINGQYWDNRINNLQFICPNCHTQTETWGKKKQ